MSFWVHEKQTANSTTKTVSHYKKAFHCLCGSSPQIVGAFLNSRSFLFFNVFKEGGEEGEALAGNNTVLNLC